jgi:hypothetical protein
LLLNRLRTGLLLGLLRLLLRWLLRGRSRILALRSGEGWNSQEGTSQRQA